jgi:hypothetical protein
MIPHELYIADVYFSPILLVIVLAFVFTTITAVILNKLKISQYLMMPPIIFLSLMIIYSMIIDKYLVGF